MSASLPAITGDQLVTLLEKDGWSNEGKTTHGISMQKLVDGRHRVVIIPCKKSRSIPTKTLHDMLGMKQSGIGRSGLVDLIDKYGLN